MSKFIALVSKRFQELSALVISRMTKIQLDHDIHKSISEEAFFNLVNLCAANLQELRISDEIWHEQITIKRMNKRSNTSFNFGASIVRVQHRGQRKTKKFEKRVPGIRKNEKFLFGDTPRRRFCFIIVRQVSKYEKFELYLRSLRRFGSQWTEVLPARRKNA